MQISIFGFWLLRLECVYDCSTFSAICGLHRCIPVHSDTQRIKSRSLLSGPAAHYIDSALNAMYPHALVILEDSQCQVLQDTKGKHASETERRRPVYLPACRFKICWELITNARLHLNYPTATHKSIWKVDLETCLHLLSPPTSFHTGVRVPQARLKGRGGWSHCSTGRS